MKLEVRLQREAVKTLDRVDRTLEQRLRNRIEEPAASPFDPRLSEQLTGLSGIRKSRVGGWRIVFEVNEQAGVIEVLLIQPRGQVYKRL